ncbi:MAG: hypothetical protein ACLFVW_03270 [Phycisphaerae bacterium]
MRFQIPLALVVLLAAILALGPVVPASAQEPDLPAGLAPDEPDEGDGAPASDEPALPGGLDEDSEDTGPALPEGLADGPQDEPDEESTDERPPLWEQLGLTGFWEIRGGIRTQPDRHQKDASIGEARLQLEWKDQWEALNFAVRADLLYDPVYDHHTVDLDEGQGLLDLREAKVGFSPLEFIDVEAGRQILTWGTGDLLFLNDLFPKDWVSFLTGRDIEYLKAPSDAVKVSVFGDLVNVDFVYTPVFDADRYVRGERLSYYSSTLGRRAGRDARIHGDEPETWFRDAEYAVRVHHNIDSYELAGYGYWGYWKSPGGMDPVTGKATFPRLNVYGASVRGPALWGIANAEVAYYQSREDQSGSDPTVNNSQMRFLLGWERDLPEIAGDFSVAAQYYVEWMLDYDDYLRTLPPNAPAEDEDRHVVTLRLTKQYLNQNLTLSFFAFYSPTDEDAYLRPNISYDVTDNWRVELGGNVFFGKHEHTFFNQFARNSNVYGALRYSF